MINSTLQIPDRFLPAFARLRQEFARQELPSKQLDRNLLIAAWNIRHLISYQEDKEWLDIPRLPPPLPEEWQKTDQTSRDPFALHFIAAIIAQFDVVMLTEVRADASAVRAILDILGPNWDILIQDVSAERHGMERLVYFFDRRRVAPSGLVCEIVLPPQRRSQAASGKRRVGQRQFARSPYAAGFESGPFAFTLVALHIKLSSGTRVREDELASIAERLISWKNQRDRWAPNLIAIGDFQLHDEKNRPPKDNPMYQAFTSTKLHIPDTLQNIQSLLFDEPGLSGGLAWFEDSLELPPLRSGNFNFVGVLEETRFQDFDFSSVSIPDFENDRFWRYLPDEELRRKAYVMGKYISDKLPLWVEFSIRDHKYKTNDER